jgi:hypothetical protein
MSQRTRTYAEGTVNDADADTFSGEETMKPRTGLILLLVIVLAVPALAVPNGNGNNGNGNQPLDIDVNNYLDVNNYNTNKNYNDNFNFNDNDNYNFNLNNNYNFVKVDQDQSQKQIQNQVQLQHQEQDQKQKQDQHQENIQIVTVPIPKGADGGILLSRSNEATKISQLDGGEAKAFSRLLYPGEVLTVAVSGGDVITLLSASDVALYTIGGTTGDIDKINSLEAVPTYDPYLTHGFEWGFVVPVDRVDYWTTKAKLTASYGATYAVIDNRAPINGYTHIEVTLAPGTYTFEEPYEFPKVVLKPDIYPTDEYGRAITG